MGTSDGTVVGATKVVDHGADADRWNLVVVGDGYRSDQQADFESAVTSLTSTLQGIAPFDAAWERINVHRLDVHSDETGADNPATCADGSSPAGAATSARTYFDASFCNNGIRRLLVVDAALVVTTVNAEVPEWDGILVVVNHTEYGGSGGTVAVYSTAPSAVDIAIHEMGHSAFGLADEYEYYAGCNSGETDRNNHPATEPSEPNVTIVSDRATLKWRHLVDSATDVPTTENGDCTRCDTQANPASATTIGLFEGAHYYHCDAYRPAFDCRMRTMGQALFCAVCQEAIKKKIGAVAKPACFVASAVYGDPFHRDVVLLRRWRDRVIARGGAGGTAMRLAAGTYARLGPRAAQYAATHPRVGRALRRRALVPLVAALRRRTGDLPPVAVTAQRSGEKS
ncbi:MAG TPA: M64 family metallopeptidase [Candidatus Limnocylindria bacterium]|nr:M64 family metallopeptidase [Candidatus Limnocylindria bacterium]